MKNFRFKLIFFFFLFLWAAVMSKLFFIQVTNSNLYKALAQGQQKFLSSFQGERGEIFLRDRENLIPLAVNRSHQFCYISPREIKDPEELAENLSKILSLEKDKILEKINSQDQENLFVILKQRISDEEVANLKKLNVVGIYLGEKELRDYPQDTLASHVIGFLGGEGKGQYGAEGYFDERLLGKEGFLEGERGPIGPLFNFSGSSDQKGVDILLTIDYNIQFMAEKLLKEAKEKFEIEEGQIIAMEPDTGKILALAQYPTFNPNLYSEEENLEVFQNSAIQQTFEPGSVFKPIVMAAALDQEKITPQTTYTDPGIIKIGGWPIYNYGQKVYPGEISMTEVLEKSINTGAVFAERQVGDKSFLEYIKRFGFFEETGIDLQGEDLSPNEEFKKGYEVNFATASFGQGIAITPIQLTRAFSVIANSGKLVKPFVAEEFYEDGNTTENKSEFSKPVISNKTATQLTAMLVSVVENGSGKLAKIPGYYIAGKTGTAQVPWSALEIDKKGYSEKTIQTFAGFGPAFNPKFLILVKLNNPNTKTAEYSAAPIFQEMAKYIIDLEQIPPDYEPR